MDRTQRLRTAGGGAISSEHASWGGPQSALLAVMTVAALIVALFAYLILRAGPSLLASVGPWIASLPAATASGGWIAPSIAVGTLLAGGSIAAWGLAAFVQGVRTDPFRWLAPVLIAFSSVVMTRLGLERSMGPLPATLFGALTALLLLGGGVLVQAQGLMVAVTGAVLLALPLLGLVLDQAHFARGIENLLLVRDPNTLLSLLVLSMTSVGVGLTAFVGRPSGSLARAASRSREWDRHREQLGQALERARVSELRLATVEERAKVMEQALHERTGVAESWAAEDEAFAASMKPQGAQRWFIAFGMLVIGASLGAVGLHIAMVKPLHAQVAGERGMATAELDKRAGEVATLRTELSGERARLSELLVIEKANTAKALAEAEAAKTQLAALTTQAAAAPAVEEKVEAPKKRVSRATKRAAAKQKAPAAARDTTGLRDAVSDDPIGGLE
jgi:hypothetical protein